MRNLSNWVEIASLFIGIAAVVVTAFTGLFLRRFQNKARVEHSSEVEAIASAVKATAPSSSSGQSREEEWTVVRRLVNEYHGQALSQAKVQFWFSVVAASSGFVLIIVAIIMVLLGRTPIMQASVQLVSGIIIEAVAALFFKQASETRERATALYDRLRTDRERSYALALVETIDENVVRNAIKAELALHMAGLSQTHLLPNLIEAIEVRSQRAREMSISKDGSAAPEENVAVTSSNGQ